MGPGYGADNHVKLYLHVKDVSGAESICNIGTVRVSILSYNYKKKTNLKFGKNIRNVSTHRVILLSRNNLISPGNSCLD